MTTKYTPSKIVEENLHYSIPIYQRLFEWDEENVETLMDDLHRTFTNNPDEDYHIGLLTATYEGDLVDGQQRFTVMTLIGCVLSTNEKIKSDDWRNFILPKSPRLQFKSRPKDVAYLRQVMEEEIWGDEGGYVNLKMKRALETINTYVSKLEDAKLFADFMYHHICFFISKLPEHYSVRNLNKYFERMNSTGKNLEQHEILKVKLLRNLSKNIPQQMQLWNKISEVDKLLISVRKHHNETSSDFKYRRQLILNSDFDSIFSENLINGISITANIDAHESISIRDIAPSEIPPKSRTSVIKNSSSVLSFPMILLLTLYWKLEQDNKREEIRSLKEFFNPANLLEIFSTHLPFEGSMVDENNIEDFIYRLLKVRLTLDYCFIRSTDYGYKLEMDDTESEDGMNLMMLESMLFVSSNRYSYYRWFTTLINCISANNKFPTPEHLYSTLKKADDGNNPLPAYVELSYGQEIRYWFWKLDFYIWKNRKVIFKNYPDSLQIAENYRFVRNRSIEHVAPQTPMRESTIKWDDTIADKALMNSFGNLVMISNGLNSSLLNQPYEVKKAYVQAYINGSMNGTIESLSLLLLNTLYDKWDKEKIADYGSMTYKYLQDSYL